MKNLKVFAIALSALVVFAGCGNMSNTTKGGLIGGGGGAALGTLAGVLIGGSPGSAAIGAAVGTAVGTTAGILIGKKMDKAKAAAAAVENAKVEEVTDQNGLKAVKITFDSGILFPSGSSTLSSSAQSSLQKFANDVLKVNKDMDCSIQGYTDNTGWKGSTAEQSAQKNQQLSLQRAQAVSTYLVNLGVPASQIKAIEGFGEANPVADNSTNEGKTQNRRVEVYIYASEAMINAANAGTLQ
ncbi:MAG: OmpA family protein [Bacteroidaceae bacterium]|nr:OmpA family protein [Bacteroidaceae bacterium]